jgi:asparagine synthase (glutamine-hydrolysing)
LAHEGTVGTMSGFLALIDPKGILQAESNVAPMLAALAERGDRLDVRRDGEALLAVGRFDWELTGEFSGPAFVVDDGEIAVVADANVYYRDDLRRSLAAKGVRPSGETASHLIAAAYRAWGTECAQHIEGDYAFVVYDRARRRTFAARDFMGRRPLYYAELDGGLLIGSSVRALIAHPSCSRELDRVALAEIIAASLAGHERTPFEAIRALPSATSLERDASGRLRRNRYWALALEEHADGETFDEAAEHLRALVSAAIVERRAVSSPTVIWLSGGYDSPALYGIGNAANERLGFDRLTPISVSYPVGDSGREDELISEITAFWRAQPAWVSIEDIPLFGHVWENAARADIPYQHAFQNWNRALLGATSQQHARVALYGDGGDQLFAVSSVFLHDLFTDIRWRELRRELRAYGRRGVRELWTLVARPVLAQRIRDLRGNTIADFPLPGWLDAGFIARHAIDARHAEANAEFAGGGEAAHETRRSLGNPIVPRVLTGLSAMGLEYGVDMRAPLFDRRIVEFALTRPRRERASGAAVKHLLRRAARTVLPPSVLTPRGRRTGALTDYFNRSFRQDPDGLVSDVFSRSVLAELGIVDGTALQQAWHRYKTSGSGLSTHLFFTFQTETWLSTRVRPSVPMPESFGQVIRTPAAGFVQ